MIAMDWNHPSFDLDMELLCTLPVEPNYAPLSVLCEDFGFEKQEVIQAAFGRLRDHGRVIKTKNIGELRQVCIGFADRLAATEEAQRYWNTVYGEQTENVGGYSDNSRLTA